MICAKIILHMAMAMHRIIIFPFPICPMSKIGRYIEYMCFSYWEMVIAPFNRTKKLILRFVQWIPIWVEMRGWMLMHVDAYQAFFHQKRDGVHLHGGTPKSSILRRNSFLLVPSSGVAFFWKFLRRRPTRPGCSQWDIHGAGTLGVWVSWLT